MKIIFFNYLNKFPKANFYFNYYNAKIFKKKKIFKEKKFLKKMIIIFKKKTNIKKKLILKKKNKITYFTLLKNFNKLQKKKLFIKFEKKALFLNYVFKLYSKPFYFVKNLNPIFFLFKTNLIEKKIQLKKTLFLKKKKINNKNLLKFNNYFNFFFFFINQIINKKIILLFSKFFKNKLKKKNYFKFLKTKTNYYLSDLIYLNKIFNKIKKIKKINKVSFFLKKRKNYLLKKKNYLIIKFQYLYLKFNILKKKNYIKNYNIFFQKKKKFLNFDSNKNYIRTLKKTNFILNYTGFLYLNNNFKFFNLKYSYLFKKTLFSFSLDIGIQKLILKRYFKNKFFYIFNNLKTKLDFLDFQNKNFFFFNSNLLNYTDNNLDKFKNFSIPYDFSIKRVKFKPGYMNIWRRARLVLKKNLNLKMIYQYKLTSYLLKFNKVLKNKIFFFFELTLKTVIFNSKIIIDSTEINYLIKKNNIYLNGNICLNPKMQIFANDFIQCIISLKYYITYKWFWTTFLKKKFKFKFKSFKKVKKIYKFTKIRSFSLFSWIWTNKNLINDINKFLEVDFLTMSVFLLYEPIFLNNFNIYNFLIYKNTIMNLYNWKYVN